jgi:hypothetical protein
MQIVQKQSCRHVSTLVNATTFFCLLIVQILKQIFTHEIQPKHVAK